VKRLCADDSAATSVKVGYRQASYKEKTRSGMSGFFFVRQNACCRSVRHKKPVGSVTGFLFLLAVEAAVLA
jgi:hypothetical protein